MIVGLPKEIKDNEYRVGLVPAGARALDRRRTQSRSSSAERARVQALTDALYERAGATLVDSPDEVWQRSRDDRESQRAD
ncbi:MAG: hypothetical protein WKF84_18930 [Pyrinomonadaceae bacterium]